MIEVLHLFGGPSSAALHLYHEHTDPDPTLAPKSGVDA
jgi:hypothetical protein